METSHFNYRILCTYPGDTFCVQERVADGGWMETHHCEFKGEWGYYEAKAWIRRKEAEK